MEGEIGPEEGARRYAEALREQVATTGAPNRRTALPVLDLILLHRKDKAFILNTWTL